MGKLILIGNGSGISNQLLTISKVPIEDSRDPGQLRNRREGMEGGEPHDRYAHAPYFDAPSSPLKRPPALN